MKALVVGEGEGKKKKKKEAKKREGGDGGEKSPAAAKSDVPEAIYQGDGGFKYLNNSMKFARNADVSDASDDESGGDE